MNIENFAEEYKNTIFNIFDSWNVGCCSCLSVDCREFAKTEAKSIRK